MNNIENFESLRREINDLMKAAYVQKEYFEKYKSDKDNVQNVKMRYHENSEKIAELKTEFKNFIKNKFQTNPLFLKDRIQSHLKLINDIEHFSEDRCSGTRVYSAERLENIEVLKRTWIELPEKKEVPQTFLIPEYEMFRQMNHRKHPEEFSKSHTTLLKIQEIEMIRQTLAKLHKQNFNNDIKIDKGYAWGIPEKESEDALKNYPVIAEEIKMKETELRHLLRDITQNIPEVIDIWAILHLYSCISIVNFAGSTNANTVEKDSVRLGLAEETFENWQKVSFENIDFIIPNIYYLSDYDSHFNEIYKKFESE